MVGGLESKAAEKGLVEMLKMHPDARRICFNMFEAEAGTMVRVLRGRRSPWEHDKAQSLGVG